MLFVVSMTIEMLQIAPDETTAATIEKRLREAIIQLEFRPGARLSEQEIASRYGVSRQPVREALIALAKSKLVEIRPNRGTVVVRISVQQMLEARFVREAVEVAVVRRACESFDPFMRERVRSNLEQQEAAIASSDHDRFRLLDEQFHIHIAQGAGCQLAWTAIADMKAHMDRVCSLTLKYPHARQALLDQHRAIFSAIEAHDADRAEAEMRAHLHAILLDLPKVEAEHGDLFDPTI